MGRKRISLVISLCSLVAWVPRAGAFDISSIISPAITASDVEVLIWVKNGVDPADEARVLADIDTALGWWEAVPTSHLSFDVVQVAHSATEPPRLPHQLMIIVGNAADLTSGGASPPVSGNPGTWFGAVADSLTIEMTKVAAHEVGHAIGFGHSTISQAFAPGNYPNMHWAVAGTVPQLSADDIAAISVAYPNPAQPLSATTGTIRGRLVIQGTTIPISGVNVVAVEQATGEPRVARQTGPRITPFPSPADGVFELVGLAPGTYEVQMLDGHSYRGFVLGVSFPGDGITSGGMRMGYQADNFATFSAAPVSVNAGQVVDLGDVGVEIWPMSFDGMHQGSLDPGTVFDPPPTDYLPDATAGMPYELWLHIRGGLRDISASAVGVPLGLTGSISGDTRGYIAGIHGNHFFRLEGTPVSPGYATVDIELVDARSRMARSAYNLAIQPLPPSGLVAWYRFHGNMLDSSGNGHTAFNLGAQFAPDRFGVQNRAVAFDGQNDFLVLPDEQDFDMPEFTIVLVMKLGRPSTEDDWIVSKGRLFGNYTLRHRGSGGTWPGHAAYVHQTLGGNWSSVASSAPLPQSQFFCWAVSRSSTDFKSYLDGQLVKHVSNPAEPRFNDHPVLVGGGGYYRTSEFFNGIVDELLIYRGALSDARVGDLCRRLFDRRRPFRLPPGDVLQVPFDELPRWIEKVKRLPGGVPGTGKAEKPKK